MAVSLAVVVAVTAAVGGYIYVQTGAAVATDTRQDLRSATELRSETVAQWVHRLEDHADTLAVRAPVDDGPAAVDGFVESESEDLPRSVVAVHYVDTGDWTALASTSDAVEGSDVSDRPWADSDGSAGGAAASGADAGGGSASASTPGDDAATVSAPYTGPASEAPTVGVVRRMDGDRAVVLVVDLASRSMGWGTFTEDSFTHVVNSHGTVVMSHRTDQIARQNVGGEGMDSPAVARGLNGSTGYVEMNMGGQVVAMGYAPVEGTDWVVMTHVPKQNAFALQRQVTGSVVGLVLASLLGLGAIGAVLGRNTAVSLRELSGKATELADGDLGVALSTDRRDEIGDLYASFAAMRDSLGERIEEAEAARRRAEAQKAELETLADHLEGKADEFSRVMGHAAEGDLTRRMDPDSRSDAMAEIAREFNDMMDQIERTAGRVKRFADEVATGSAEVTHGASEVERSSEQVTRSVQEISDGVASQNEQFQSVSESMREVSATTEEIAASSRQVSETAERTAAAGARGREAAEVAIEGMTGVETEARESVDEIVRLQEQMSEIGDIVEFIREIAEQTGVLALNANIEAARAGAAGEGFGVVADEVQALAGETKDAADDVESLIESLQGQTERTAAEVRRTREEVADSADAVRNAVSALEDIAELAEETNAGVQEIHDASEQQADSTETVVSMVDEAATVSEAMSGEAQNVAAAAEEQASALTQVTSNADELAAQAESLREQLDRFETDVEPAAGAADGSADVAASDDD